MRSTLLDVWNGRTSLSRDGSSLQGVSEPLLLREDDAYPELEVTPEAGTLFSATNEAEKQEPASTATRPAPIATAIPQIDPRPAAPIPQSDPQIDAAALFVQGWTSGGGDAVSLRLVLCVMGKESGGDPYAYNAAGPFYGLMQFLGSTWDAMGGGDWRDPYRQGVNTARLWRAASPANQWPVAYRLCVGGG